MIVQINRPGNPCSLRFVNVNHVVFTSIIGGSRLLGSSLFDNLPGVLVSCCLTALSRGDKAASQWVPRILQMMENYPETAELFIQQVCDHEFFCRFG